MPRVVPIHERLLEFATVAEEVADEIEAAVNDNARRLACTKLRMVVLALYTEARVFEEFENQMNTEKVG
jgi:hypothetical protein